MTYYIKGGSKYNEVNPTVWVINHLSGYTEADYVDPNWKDINASGAVGDPYWRLGGEGGQNWAEFGISGSYGIRIDENGISGFDGSFWTGLGGGAGGDNLGDHIATQILDMGAYGITGNDEGLIFTFGRVQLGHTSYPTYGYFGYRSSSSSQYAVLQGSDFTTYLNAGNGGTIFFRIDNATKMSMNASALTMSVPIDMQENLLTLGNAGVADPIELLKFEIERGWSFRKRGVGSSTRLALESDVNSKYFWIGYDNGTSWASKHYITEVQADNYVDLYKLKINGGGVLIDEIINNDSLSTSDVKLCTVGNVKAYADTKEVANANIQSHVASPATSAHHVKYTDTNARAALGNVIDSNGHLDADLDADGRGLIDANRVHFRDNVNASIELEDHFTTDHRYHGITIDITCAVGFGSPVYISANNTVATASSDSSNTMPCIGFSVGTNKVLIYGVIYDLTTTFVAGNPIYVQGQGPVDDTIPPNVGDIIQVVGIAIDVNTLLVNPSPVWVVRN